MNLPAAILTTNDFVLRLGWTLVHFVWQGALLALIGAIVMRWLTVTASARYITGVATLAAMLAAPLVTFAWLPAQLAPLDATSSAASLSGLPAGIGDPAGAAISAASQPPAPIPALPLLVFAWVLGVAALSVRLAGGWIVTRRLVSRGISPVSEEIQRLAADVATRLELRRLTRVVESTAVTVPVMVGWLKPVVLLPASALSGLTMAQIEGVIAHELAHVRRHDYLVNLLQSAVETLLFYHPAVWWISKEVRAEREHCCDDLAVAVCDRVVYVSALTDLAAMARPQFALAATDGSLLRRVRRILDAHGAAAPTGGWTGPVALLLLLVVGAGVAPIVVASTSASPSTLTDERSGRSVEQPTTAADAFLPAVRPTSSLAGLTLGEPRMALAEQAGPASSDAAIDAERRLAVEQDTMDFVQRRLAEMQERMIATAKRRIELDNRKAQDEARVMIDAMQKEVERLRERQQDVKAKFDVGVANREAVAEAEGRLIEAEMKLTMAEADLKYRATTADLAAEQATYERVYKQLSSRYERMVQDAERMRAEMLAREMQRPPGVTLGFPPGGTLQFYEHSDATGLMGNEEQPRTARIAAEDHVALEIDGEPELKRFYYVGTEGTITLPLLGAVKVQGLTGPQVEETIAKLLTDRKLGATKTVKARVFRRTR